MDESKDKMITRELAWERIDDVISYLMKSDSIADTRAYAIEKYGTVRDKISNFCGFFDPLINADATGLDCEECPFSQEFQQTPYMDWCWMLFPCRPDEYAEYL